MYIFHDSRNNEYRDPFGALQAGTRVTLTVDVAECDVRNVEVEFWQDGEARQYIPMREKDGQDSVRRFTATFKVPEAGLFWYRFRVAYLSDGVISRMWYGNNEACTGGAGRMGKENGLAPFQITSYVPTETPDWYKDGIVYQIFPDRFARDEGWRERTEKACEAVNERRSDMKRVIQDDWYRPAFYVRDETNKVIEWPMYGGSLKGIEQRLDYLKSLGVTAIYLNPVFEASSNHRYDTGNYMKIDPALGTDDDFRSLAASAREKDIRLILDGVFSHTGSDSIYFDKYGNYPLATGTDPLAKSSQNADPAASTAGKSQGAWQSEDSPYRSWFKFDSSEEHGYKSWWGVEDLPEVEETDESYRKFILGEDGVVGHWMRMGASGWRLDVADELPDSFIEETRKRVRETDPEGLLIGEVWEDASNKISYGERRRYLMGDELDGCMNYPLRDILLDYVNYTISSGFAAEKLRSLEENYPKEAFYSNLNLIGSHDRERILTAMAAEEDLESAVRKVKLLSALQYALPGVPCIYYGDEAGLAGGADPENRSGFPWGSENLDLAYHYRMLGLIYDEHPALKDGGFEMLSGEEGISEDVFAFTRSGKDSAGNEETLLVLANRSYGETYVDLSGIESLSCGYALELMASEELPVDEEGRLLPIRMERLSAMIISLRAERPHREDLGRDCGVVCHISSLGTPLLGKPARDFVDWLSDAGFGIWQVLPLNPAGLGGSPYSSYSAFAGDPRFINRDELPSADGFSDFVKKNKYWLKEYAAFTILKEANDDKPWYEWPENHRNESPDSILAVLVRDRKERANELAWDQYCFYVQWRDLKKYANSKGIRIMGDLPMFMSANSADVWANKSIFRMDAQGRQKVHAGVPPDAFSGEGQDWGNPLYDWDEIRKTGYKWWLKRMYQCAERFDILRIDHFRGLSEYYAIPEGGGPHDGFWQHGPGLAFVTAVREMIRKEGLGMKILAEDLGYLDAGVKNLMKLSGLPGMDIWQFNADDMTELCEREPEKACMRAFYTGTHDNDTLAGWLSSTGREDHIKDQAQDAISRIYWSPAMLAMLQLQDVFFLGSDARMNVPGIPEGNWTWKIPGESIYDAFPDAADRAEWFRELAERTGRKPRR